MCGFKKDIGVDLFELDLFPSLYIGLLFTDGHDTDTAKFEKVKVQNSVELKYKFYKAMLKISSFWKGFSQSTKLDSRYTSEEERHSFWGIPAVQFCWLTEGTPSHHNYFVTWLWQKLMSQIVIHSDVKMSRYFLQVMWSHRDDITRSWRGVSPGRLSQELYLSNFGDHRPSRSEDNFNFTYSKKLITVRCYFAPLPLKKKCSIILIFSKKSFWFINSNGFPFLSELNIDNFY